MEISLGRAKKNFIREKVAIILRRINKILKIIYDFGARAKRPRTSAVIFIDFPNRCFHTMECGDEK